MDIVLTGQDVLLLKMIDDHASIVEIAMALKTSQGTIHKRLVRMENMPDPWITPPPTRKQARGRKLTAYGKQLLRKYYQDQSHD